MRSIRLEDFTDFDEWRERARELLGDQTPPEAVSWNSGFSNSLFGDDPPSPKPQGNTASDKAGQRVPREFLGLADRVLAHSDPQRFGLLYRMLWRLTHGEPQLLHLLTDADMVRAIAMEKSVRRDLHKMKAFVRFRELPAPDGGEPIFVSWFEPEHYILERVAPFFVRRFAGMRWSILTPYRSAHWDGTQLAIAAGANKSDAAGEDVLEDLWRTYYASIFNPARLKVQAMKSEMPVKYWKNLPEARLIPGLIREAMPRAQAMVQAAPTLPRNRMAEVAAPQKAIELIEAGSLEALRALARDCRRCPLWQPATQTVFGEGPRDARIMLVGEQPGDLEDLGGHPFIGPAGKLLDQALGEAGLDRSDFYLTNAVKHFKFEARGKQRLHKRADAREQAACKPWLDAEIALIQPLIIVALGVTASQALFGPKFRLLQQRGQWLELGVGVHAFATVHPSYLLRLPDAAARERGYADFVADLRLLSAIEPTVDRGLA